jgi:alkanesulfonate monooxygenase SsuD/methylene tetrahydromethanopterin reductase-like flavin-dependent oxidoreductase (luciferase family)
MRVVAESADIWNNWTSPDLETYKGKLAALNRHCDDVGRDPSTIRKSLHIKPIIGESQREVAESAGRSDNHRSQGTVEEVTADLLAFVEAGVGDFVYMLDSTTDERSLELLAKKVAPVVRSEGSRLLERHLSG